MKIEEGIYIPTAKANDYVQSILKLISRIYQSVRPGRNYLRVSKKPRNKWTQLKKVCPEKERERSRKRQRAKVKP